MQIPIPKVETILSSQSARTTPYSGISFQSESFNHNRWPRVTLWLLLGLGLGEGGGNRQNLKL